MNQAVTFFPATAYVVTIGATSATGPATTAGVNTLRLVATVACWVTIAPGGVAAAATTSLYLPAGVVEYFRVPDAGTAKVTVLEASGAGTLSITELTR